ncbi:MAG: mechanosensitive ion channel, partial [Thermodesulfobacteriota bacterium]|nr:mechanosensitive ion channel [Thermodesulfobacteriota bacterium]
KSLIPVIDRIRNRFSIGQFCIVSDRGMISAGTMKQLEDPDRSIPYIFGARCTRVRTGENIDILVPNSSFLEKNITNWTLSDKKIRTKIVAGVCFMGNVRAV